MDTNFVDLRSDTVTRPTQEMRRAMYEAEVGDDNYGEDPTVRNLEEQFASKVGKEAAIFTPSGVMANQIAIRTHARPGMLVAAGKNQHVVVYEKGGGARNAGIQFHLLDDSTGTFGPEEITELVQASDYSRMELGLICVENTHMPSGGRCWSLDELKGVSGAAGSIPIHMDGARLFNASVARGIDPAKYASYATSVMCCISKGLGAPVGSLLAGSKEFIERARFERAVLGGQMRQVGILAAAGLVALNRMTERLAEDHERAKMLARAVSEKWPDSGINPEEVETNIVVFRINNLDEVVSHLNNHGVLARGIGPGLMRFVTHFDVDDVGIDRAIAAIASAPKE